jgi:dihydrofolate reductase
VTLTLVVCAARNGTIGRGGTMPWRMPSDLRHFKAVTLGKPVIMGRKTFQSIGKALPGRVNIVVSRQPGLALAGATVATDLDAALAAAAAQPGPPAEVMVIGGGEIYAQALPRADRVVLTRLDADVAGDAIFPALDPALWTVVSDTPLATAAADDHAARVLVYERTRVEAVARP